MTNLTELYAYSIKVYEKTAELKWAINVKYKIATHPESAIAEAIDNIKN